MYVRTLKLALFERVPWYDIWFYHLKIYWIKVEHFLWLWGNRYFKKPASAKLITLVNNSWKAAAQEYKGEMVRSYRNFFCNVPKENSQRRCAGYTLSNNTLNDLIYYNMTAKVRDFIENVATNTYVLYGVILIIVSAKNFLLVYNNAKKLGS